MPRLLPLRWQDGYLAIQDHGLIGDGASAVLVGRDGAVTWMCVPRVDAPPLFAGLLDSRRGGVLRASPANARASAQRYEADTGVLVTEIRTDGGLVRLTDALTLRRGADLTVQGTAWGHGELLRIAEVLEGRVTLRVSVEPRGGAVVERADPALRLRAAQHPDLGLYVAIAVLRDGTAEALPLDERASAEAELPAGARLVLSLSWGDDRPALDDAEDRMAATVEAWRRWAAGVSYAGPREALVRRSALTLKLLDHFGGGAIVAAPTSSLPEAVGGSRNWDYRYAWVRDAAFTVYALHRIGLWSEAYGFLTWALSAAARGGRPRVLYDVDGRPPPPERVDDGLEGYRRSAPVRWGNAAADQIQNDVFGEMLDCAYQWGAHHRAIDESQWEQLRPLVETALTSWDEPDRGIWEVRTSSRPFTYSAALCQVALDRGVRLAERFGLRGDVAGWRAGADAIRDRILRDAWNPRLGTLAQTLGGDTVDGSLLALPLRRVVPADHPRMVATTAAVVSRLGAGNGLLYRYIPAESPDGLPGGEGAFLLCSFWLVDNWAYQGRVDDALELFDALCDRAGQLGLLSEQVDPSTGDFLGNYPQGLSHAGLISSGYNLARRLAEREGDTAEDGAPSGGRERVVR